MKEIKKKSWQMYVNQLGSCTRINIIWMMMKKISGKPQPSALKHLTKNKTEATTNEDRADTFVKTFSANSSLNNSNPHFFTFKNHTEK